MACLLLHSAQCKTSPTVADRKQKARVGKARRQLPGGLAAVIRIDSEIPGL